MSLSDTPSAASSAPRRTLSLTLAVVLLVAVAAVAVGATAGYYALHPSSPAPGPGDVTVVDDLGRTVTAPANAGKIVVLAPSVMDMVFRLGLRSSVVAVGCTASIPGGILNEYSPNQTAAWSLTNATCVTDYPTLNTEGIANASAQLVLASTITSQSAVETLTGTYHIPVVILAPSTLEGIVGDVRILGQLFPSASASARSLESELSRTLTSVTSEDANLTNAQVAVPSVLLSYYFDSGGYYTFGPGTFGASMIDLAGGSNLAGSVPLQYDEINATVVLNDQPTTILYGTSWNDPDLVAGETPGVWATAPYWSQLNGAKIPLDVTEVSEPDPTMILALPWVQHDLFPSLVPAP